MKKRKICFVIVNRANYGRIKGLMLRLKKDKSFQLQIILSSSTLLKKYGKLDSILKKDGFKISRSFYTHVEGETHSTMTKSTALSLLEISSSLSELKPDIVFTTGDRYETLATAIAASYMNIFLCHLQGGELTGSIDENVRHAVTKLSHLHFACTAKSKQRIISMGENPRKVFNVGCPSIDQIKKINFKNKVNLEKHKFGIGHRVDLNKPYHVVLIHPVTTNYNNDFLINSVLEAVYKLQTQIIWIWPNNDAGANIITRKIRSFREKKKDLKINFYTNFEVEDYLKILNKCKSLIGNSSSGIRESSFLGIPVINIGDRQKGRERSKNIHDVEIDSNEILKKINEISTIKRYTKNLIYGTGNSTSKIIKILKNTKLEIKKIFYEK